MTTTREEGFSCRIENVKALSDLLACLAADGAKDQVCYVEATSEVLVFMVSGRGKSSQGRISLETGFFEEYICSSEQINFAIKLSILIDCLRLFGPTVDTTTATMTYMVAQSVFKLSLEESGVLTVCEITPLYIEDMEEVHNSIMAAFRTTQEECQIIIKSEPLKEAMQELADSQWLDSITMEINNHPAYWKMCTGGTVGKSEIMIPRSSDVYISFQCNGPLSASYPLQTILFSMKALTVAKETCIRINSEGILCIQHQIETADGKDAYFDFFLVSEESMDE